MTHTPAKPVPRSRWLILFSIVLLVGYVWLVVLPGWSADPEFQARYQDHQSQGLNSAAMFYSDLPATQTATHRLQTLERDHPGVLWLP